MKTVLTRLMPRSTVLASAILLPLVGCTSATFTGNNPSRATLPDTKTDNDTVSCEVLPATVKPGETATIKVTTSKPLAELFESAVLVDDEATKIIDTKLVNTADGFAREDGQANTLSADKEGTYRIDLRLSADQNDVSGQCQLVVQTEPVPPEPPKPPEQCEPEQSRIGADIAFLIDNSNSNAVTDCPSSKEAGTFNGVTLYECQDQTNREKAVAAAFDLLADIAAKESSNPKAMSRFAITSFPSDTDYVTGWTDQSNGWIEANESNRDHLNQAMAFSRRPSGLTPYLAAMTGGSKAFEQSDASDGRFKVAVLVTDGEPTDSNPSEVEAKADALRAAGIKVITIYVTGSESRATRINKHTDMMRGIDQTRLKQTGKHWFASKYASFTDYMTALVGSSDGTPGLVTRISSKADASCQDTDAGQCAREVYEVQKSESLKDAFLQVIQTKAIGCEG